MYEIGGEDKRAKRLRFMAVRRKRIFVFLMLAVAVVPV
ncbi:MAG: hypothetical protein UY62_C0021G0020 [Parcubacteria group bacterium GW2011_GWF2_50_9]|nr:MAG: hypothetical protein UY62_C0021G0020 [Parcubacteria group bacterium GW2011_GWF2_50_9]